MDYASKETIFDELNNFEKKRPTEIPLILDDYLALIGKTGDIIFPWPKLKPLFKYKLDKVIKKFNDDYPAKDLPFSPNVEKFSYEQLHAKLLNTIEGFSGAPFTIQRLCELITFPDMHYKRIDKFMRALEKDLLVVSTIEPLVKRQRTDSETSSLVNGVTEATGSSNSLAQSPQSTDSSEEASVESTAQADERSCIQDGNYVYDDHGGNLDCESEAEANENQMGKDDENQAEPSDTMETTVSSSSAPEMVEQRAAELQVVQQQIKVTSNRELPTTQTTEDDVEEALSSESEVKVHVTEDNERVQPSSQGLSEIDCSSQRDSEVITDCSDAGCDVEEAADTREIVIGESVVDDSEVGGSGNVEDEQQHTKPVVSNLSDSPESSVETVPDSATHLSSSNDDHATMDSLHLTSPSSSSSPMLIVKDVDEAVVETTSPSECDEQTTAEDGMLPDSTPSVSTTSNGTLESDSGSGGGEVEDDDGSRSDEGPCHQSEPEPMDED